MARPVSPSCLLLLISLACQQSGGRLTRPGNKQALLAEARGKYTLTRQTASRDVINVPIGSGPSVDDIEVTTYEMHKNHNASPEKHHWVGAFKTNKAYDPLGFGEGLNYVFLLDAGDENHRYVVVPEQADLDARYLKYEPNLDLTGGNMDPPLAIRSKKVPSSKTDAFQVGGCLEGPCSTGHCSTTGVGDAYSGT